MWEMGVLFLGDRQQRNSGYRRRYGVEPVQAGDAPWYRYRESIKNIRFTGMADVPQGGRLSYMFCGCGNVAG